MNNASKLIIAHTPTDYQHFPPYLNLQFVDEDVVRVTVRNSDHRNQFDEPVCGHTTYIDIQRDLMIDLLTEALDKVRYD